MDASVKVEATQALKLTSHHVCNARMSHTLSKVTRRMDVNGHDAHNTKRLVVEAARPGFVDTRFPIATENCSLAVASHGWFNTGISTDIHATFVKPGGMDGDTIRVTGEVIGIGKTLAYTRVELRHIETNQLLGMCSATHAAYGSHTKYIRMGQDSPHNLVFDETGEEVRQGTPP